MRTKAGRRGAVLLGVFSTGRVRRAVGFREDVLWIMGLLDGRWEVHRGRKARPLAKLPFRNGPHLVNITAAAERLMLFCLLKALHQLLRGLKEREGAREVKLD